MKMVSMFRTLDLIIWFYHAFIYLNLTPLHDEFSRVPVYIFYFLENYCVFFIWWDISIKTYWYGLGYFPLREALMLMFFACFLDGYFFFICCDTFECLGFDLLCLSVVYAGKVTLRPWKKKKFIFGHILDFYNFLS